jgi:hypothetical protein
MTAIIRPRGFRVSSSALNKFLLTLLFLSVFDGARLVAQSNPTVGIPMSVMGLPFSAQEWKTVKTTRSNGQIAQVLIRTDIARNSVGSTRRELRRIPATGNIADPSNSSSVLIRDHANRRVMLLDVNTQTASISPLKLSIRASSLPDVVPAGAILSPQTQYLGQKAIGSFIVQGTRENFTFPVGTKSKDHIVTATRDTWYSPALQYVLETDYLDSDQHSETTLLKDILQTEPAVSLFTIPAGYTSSVRPIRKP